MKLVLGVVLTLAVAAAGYATGAYRSAPVGVVRQAEGPKQILETQLTRADIAAVVRAELAQMPLTMPIGITGPSDPPRSGATEGHDELPKRVSNPAARTRAEVIVNDAIHFAVWTDHDRALLREELAQLDSDDWLAVTRTLVIAINDGKLRVETQEMPF